ncbi:hypothetical protein DCAR_0934537 [Daucus carota subsp. sativus]|uniref:Cyanobacterial aminoacyl-tRNA synthetase CAAD domain-containing protein n=1 Tax=Daucus carota subsp. sativus TaxID=79200 RepID=A0AAF1BFJ7_DAUCS|nr:hypothetical protein DCAR_0934537 [Daucus carota subsp. sativus]
MLLPMSFKMSRIPSRFQTKASSTDESTDNGEVFTDLKEKWDAVENKSTVLLYGGGALLGVWISSILVGAINSVPLHRMHGVLSWTLYCYINRLGRLVIFKHYELRNVGNYFSGTELDN